MEIVLVFILSFVVAAIISTVLTRWFSGKWIWEEAEG